MMLIDNKMYIVHKTNISIRPIKKKCQFDIYITEIYTYLNCD